jgi:hypothetical protein
VARDLDVVEMALAGSSFCSQCFKEREFIPVHFAVAITGVSRSSIYRWIGRGHIHYLDLPSGHRMICLDSLKQVHTVDLRLLAALIKNSRPRRSSKHKHKVSHSVPTSF